MELHKGLIVCVSVKSLYYLGGHKLNITFGKIIPRMAINQYDSDHFYLYNINDELACLDNELVTVCDVGKELVTFKNTKGNKRIYFTLTREECDIAII